MTKLLSQIKMLVNNLTINNSPLSEVIQDFMDLYNENLNMFESFAGGSSILSPPKSPSALETDMDTLPLTSTVSSVTPTAILSKNIIDTNKRKNGKNLLATKSTMATPKPVQLKRQRYSTEHYTEIDAAVLASQIVRARVLRLIKSISPVGLSDPSDPNGTSDTLTYAKSAIDTFIVLTTQHVYQRIRQFVYLYSSMRARPNVDVLLIQGRFLPDFLHISSITYDDEVARVACPVELNKRKHTRPLRGLSDRPNNTQNNTQMEASSRGRYKVTLHKPAKTVDRSCILIDNKSRHTLSRKFFKELSYLLANDLKIATDSKTVKRRTFQTYRFSKEFGAEVNQLFVYTLHRAINLTAILKSNESKGRRTFRVTEKDVRLAFGYIDQSTRGERISRTRK